MAHVRAKHGGKIPERVDLFAETNDSQQRLENRNTSPNQMLQGGTTVTENGSFD